MNIKKQFGKNIKLLRQKRVLSQEQLAEILDISSVHLSKIECGKCFVSADLLEKIIINLHTDICALFTPQNKNTREELITKINNSLEDLSDNELFYIYKNIEDMKLILK